MQYTQLDAAAQKQEITDQLAFRERQHLRTMLDLAALKAAAGANPDTTDAGQITTLEQQLAMLDAAHAALTAELAKYDTATATPAPQPTNAVPDATLS